jgi:hypothetical protein
MESLERPGIIDALAAAGLILALASPALADTTHCTTREDAEAKRLITTCTDGSRAVSRYDAQAQRWYTDIVREPKGDKTPKGWPTPGKAPR